MADLITRLKVESSEYDSKIARATAGLTHYQEACRKAGGTLEYVDKDAMHFAKTLGSMDTVAKNAKGQVAELTSAYVQMSVQYKNLTDLEKQSPFGVALSASLDKLKERIKNTSAEITAAQKSLSGATGGLKLDGGGISLGGDVDLSQYRELGSIFQELGGKLGIPMDVLGKMPNLLKGASNGFGALGGSAASAGAKMAASLGPVSAAIAVFVGEVKLMTDAFKRNTEATNTSIQILAPFKALWQNFQRLFDDIVRIFVDVKNNLKGVTGEFDYFQQLLSPLTNLIVLWRTEWALVGTVLRDVTKFIGWLGNGVKTATGIIKDLVLETGFGQWLKGMKDEITGFMSYLEGLIQKIANTELGKTFGLDSLYNDLKGIFTSQSELTATNRELGQMQDAVNKKRITNTREIADLEREIAELRAQAADKAQYSAEQRVGFLEQALQKEEAIAQKEYELAQMQYNMKVKENSLLTNNDQDRLGQEEAYAAMQRAYTNLQNARRKIIRSLQAARDEMEAESRAAERNAQKDMTLLEQRNQRIQEVTASIQEMRDILDSTADENTKAWATAQLEKFQAELNTLNGIARKTRDALQITGPSGYSQEGIGALRSEIQGGMKGMQMGSSEYMFQAERLVDLTTFENLVKTAVTNGIQIDPEILERMFEGIDNATFSDNPLNIIPSISDEDWQTLVDSINEKLAELKLDPIELDVKTGSVKNAEQDLNGLSENVMGAIGMFGQLGEAMQSIEDPSAKVAGIILEAVANVAGAFAKSLMGTFNPWEFIAAAISGTATMVSTIATIKSVTSGGYANGGVIPGNSFSGDNMRGMLPNGDIVGLDAGEVILNRAQAGVVAGALQGNPMGNMALSVLLKGEDLQICLDNNNRRRGRK